MQVEAPVDGSVYHDRLVPSNIPAIIRIRHIRGEGRRFI